MQTITLPVLPKFRNNGEFGETVTATPIQMAILARKGVVNLSSLAINWSPLDMPEGPGGVADTITAEPTRRRRRYRRRDLTAE